MAYFQKLKYFDDFKIFKTKLKFYANIQKQFIRFALFISMAINNVQSKAK